MSAGSHHETELKFLIQYPDTAFLEAQSGCVKWEIEQIYLTSPEPLSTRRIRKVIVNSEAHYYRTFKRRVSDMTAEENEGEITADLYAAYKQEADPACRPIIKTRYRIPYEGHLLEFDIYPFWQDQAVMEIELENESVSPAIPPYVSIIRDVTADPAYKNHALSRAVPGDNCCRADHPEFSCH